MQEHIALLYSLSLRYVSKPVSCYKRYLRRDNYTVKEFIDLAYVKIGQCMLCANNAGRITSALFTSLNITGCAAFLFSKQAVVMVAAPPSKYTL
jgi:hypothetical protein